ncbi:MAG: YfhO family protein [Candidatus Latescibacteria bacterium]|nr:YfhO family protein [Candidatus Latescibacterota bacterium]
MITEHLPNSISLDVSLDSPGILVLGEVYYPAWKAYIDGEKVEILKANDTMRAVALRSGRHQVVMRYESAAVTWGLVISVAGVLLVLSMVILSHHRHQ